MIKVRNTTTGQEGKVEKSILTKLKHGTNFEFLLQTSHKSVKGGGTDSSYLKCICNEENQWEEVK